MSESDPTPAAPTPASTEAGATAAPPPSRVPLAWRLFFGLGPVAFVAALAFDDEISKFITSHRPERLNPVVIFITSWKCEVSLLLAISVGLLIWRRWRPILFTWGTFLVGEVIGTALKYGIGRRRPYLAHDVIENLVEEATPSFPSNHSLALFTAALSLGWCFPRLRPFALAWAVLIAFTRIYVGVHYMTDVLGGAFLAVGLVWVGTKLLGEWAKS